MYITTEQAASINAQIKSLRNTAQRLVHMATDLESDLKMLERSFSMANHPSGKAREPKLAPVLPFVSTKESN